MHKIVFRIDATTHEQFAEKMEGVEWNYKKIKCLSSQTLFDDAGFCYGFNLREGATHTSVGAIEMMEGAFNVVPKGIKKYLVADSGYSSLNVYNHLITKQVNFAICLGEKAWGALLKNYGNKISWRKTRLQFFKSDKCEIGSCLYPLKGLAEKRSHLRVVFIRTKKKKIESGENHPYHYYAIVTDMSSAEMNDEHLIRFYRKRAIIENNIKDLKQGLDFYHFPCQSLKANNVWGLMGIIAYNLMRLASFTISKNGCFVKTVRKKIVMVAGELVKHARYIEIRMMNFLKLEVERIKMILCGLYFEISKDRDGPLRKISG
ncbi:MAG TPA: transposase [Bacteriovoracaceae bacterium]|nr:transposase [Bacteriovoracaceae bacterium]